MPRSTVPAEVAAAPKNPPAVEAPAPRKRRKAKRTKARQPHNPIVMKSRAIEPMEQQIGQDNPRVMKSSGPARESLEPAHIEPVERPVDKEKLAMLAFMNEMVTVQIHTTTDKEAEQVFKIGNNGREVVLQRGGTYTLRRYFVNELASRKLTTFTQREKVVDDERVIEQVPHSALMYPFSVTRDDHPRGADWLKATLAAP